MDNTFRIYPIGIQNFEQLRNNNNVYVDKTELKMQDAIYVFEFKVDGTPEEALKQINSKGYACLLYTSLVSLRLHNNSVASATSGETLMSMANGNLR